MKRRKETEKTDTDGRILSDDRGRYRNCARRGAWKSPSPFSKRKHSWQHLDFGHLASRTVRKYVSIVLSDQVFGNLLWLIYKTNPLVYKMRLVIYTYIFLRWLSERHQFSSVQFSSSVMSNSLRPHEPQRTRPPYPSPTLRIYPNPCPSSQWCHPAISSSVISFFFCPKSLPSSGSFPTSQLFAWGGQSTGVSALASSPPKKSQGW